MHTMITDAAARDAMVIPMIAEIGISLESAGNSVGGGPHGSVSVGQTEIYSGVCHGLVGVG